MPSRMLERFTWTAFISILLLSFGWALGALDGPRAAHESTAPPGSSHRTESFGGGPGPDVTIFDLRTITNYTGSSGSSCPPGYGTGDCRGYSLGTDSCNIGSVPVDWCDEIAGCRTTTDAFHPLAPATTSDHSVIGQNMYRLKNGRFEQIGASFLKHGFLSTNSEHSECQWNDGGVPNPECMNPPAGNDQLGVGCTDFYDAPLNGYRPLGRRSEVQVAGGGHPPAANPASETDDAYDQRIVVPESDLDPSQNAGALYWMEGHYVVRDDARAGNGLNNASYRQVTVGGLPSLALTLTGPTVRELPALFAWQAADPDVEIVDVCKETLFQGEEADPPIDPGTFYPDYTITECFFAARRVTSTSRGVLPFHYEYAIYNMNSDTSADGFLVDLGQSATIANVGFRDLPHHSGEPYDTSDWAVNVDGPNGTVTWSAADAGGNTNALRWGFTFNFWFDSDIGPNPAKHTLSTFKDDGSLNVPFEGGAMIFSDGFESGNISRWN